MMSLFLDSNVIIEFAKDNPKAVKLLETLFNGEFRVFINSIVYSEFLHILKGKNRERLLGIEKR